MKFFETIKGFWSKIKQPLLKLTLSKLDDFKKPLADLIAKHEGTPEQQAEKIIEQIKAYLVKQL